MRRLVRGLALAGAVAGAAGCTNVRLSQRNGCWVRETHHTARGTQEDIGPCAKPPPKWSEDRLTRIIQECVAQADYRWEVRALAAWNRHEPLPAQDAQESVITTCMNEAAASDVMQNETLRQRLAEISSDRESLRSEAARGAEQLRANTDRLVGYLGEAANEAAKRPTPTATATATSTSDGTATTDTGLQADTGLTAETAAAGPPAATVVAASPDTPVGAGATQAAGAPPGPKVEPSAARGASDANGRVARRLAAARARKARTARLARGTGCELPAPKGAPATEAVAAPAAAAPAPAPGPATAR